MPKVPPLSSWFALADMHLRPDRRRRPDHVPLLPVASHTYPVGHSISPGLLRVFQQGSTPQRSIATQCGLEQLKQASERNGSLIFRCPS